MTISQAADFTLAQLRTRLSQHLNGGVLDLSDELLGQPLLDRLFHNPVLSVTAAQLDLSAPDAVDLHGTADLLGASGVALDLRISQDESALVGLLDLVTTPGSPVRLSGILGSVAGTGVTLPPEVPDLGFTALTFSITPQTGAFVLDCTCEVPWSLPFGGAGLAVGQAELRLERTGDEDAPVQVKLRLGSAGTLVVADGFQVTGFNLVFAHSGAGTWVLDGTLDVNLLDHPLELGASITASEDRCEFAFRATTSAPVSVDLAGLGSLSMRELSILVARSVGAAAQEGGAQLGSGAQESGARLDQDSAYTWAVEAAGVIDLLDEAIVVDGTVSVRGEPGKLSLALRPGTEGSAADVVVPLPAAPSVKTHLAFGSMEVSRELAGEGISWSVAAEATVWFSGLPGGLDTVLPGSRDTDLTGTFSMTTGAEAGVSFTVDPVLPRQPFHLPTITVDELDLDLDLSQAKSAVQVGRLDVRWARNGGVSVGAEFAVGIPAQLNQIFGTGHDLFATYDENVPDSLMRMRLSASDNNGSPSLQLHPLTSPLKKLVFEPATSGGSDRQATVDLGEYGSFSFVVPTLAVQGDTVRAHGGFTQKDLALSMAPVKRLTTALGIGGVNKFLPKSLPLRDLKLYDDATGLDVTTVFKLLMTPLRAVPGITLPDDDVVRQALQKLAAHATMLPDRLKPYLNIHIPKSLSYDLTVSAEGALFGGISVAAPGGAAPSRAVDTPLRMLIPGMSTTGPMLTGIELWNLQIGEILGGSALLVRADLNIDQFDLLTLAALLATPTELASALPDPRQITRRLVAERVTLLVVPEIPVAVPVFFDDLGLEYRGIEGADFGGHLSFPEPDLNLTQALADYQRLKSFFTDPDAMLNPGDISGHGLDLEFTAGPLFLQLPGYLGGATLGSRTATTSVSVAASIADLLNGLKKLRLDKLLSALPAALLHAPPAAKPHLNLGPLALDAGWDITAPAGATRRLAAHLTGTAALGPLARLATTLDVKTAGNSGVDLAFTADTDVAGMLGLHLEGSIVNAPTDASGSTATALRFTDPSARVVTSGPVWQPQTFTVEWWMRPTSLRDWNQFISGADVWGSFAFHTTANGAVYCGTDVNTRFTPSELPAGTVQLNTWQHFAFTYSNGDASLFKNGVKLAQKSGLTRPAPWTGMRLGIPDAGSQPDGLVSELRVWDTCRSDGTIVLGMTHRLSGAETGLVGYWPLDEGSGDVIRDHGPSGFNGTASHTAWTPVAAGTSQPPPPIAALRTDNPAVQMTGSSTLRLLDRQVFSGEVRLAPGSASLKGRLDLFGDNNPLSVRGNLFGSINAQQFSLTGNASVHLDRMSLASGTAAITDSKLAVSGKWLDLFDTNLALEIRAGHTVLTGKVSGSRSIDVRYGTVIVQTVFGPVKVADGFHFKGTCGFTLTVTAHETDGVSAVGTVTINDSPLTLRLSLGTVPGTLQELDQSIITAIQGNTATVFKTLYGQAEAWVKGVASQAITWSHTAWQQTGLALQCAYNTAEPEVAKLLDANGYAIGEVGQVLRATFANVGSDPTGAVLGILKQTGFPVEKVARALDGGFQDVISRANRDSTVRDLVHIMRNQYGAVDLAKVAFQYNLIDTSATRILTDAGYIPRELADALAFPGSYHRTYEQVADVFNRTSMAPADMIRGLSHTFPYTPTQVADYLYRKGYAARNVLNDFLDLIQAPRI
jgi:hypothetical protein